MNVSPTVSNVNAALRNFLGAALPADVEIVAGQANRVAEPKSRRFVVMQPPMFARFATNRDASADSQFAGSIAAGVLTVTAVEIGQVTVGATLFGAAPNTTVTSQLSGTPGGAGTYKVAPTQDLAPSGILSTGQTTITQSAEVIIDLDFHSADGTAGDLAMTVSTLLRDEFGVSQFLGQSPNYGVTPLYADDPRQIPFVNDQQQVEWRWRLETHLQADQAVAVPQQYADAVDVTLVSVDAAYPP